MHGDRKRGRRRRGEGKGEEVDARMRMHHQCLNRIECFGDRLTQIVRTEEKKKGSRKRVEGGGREGWVGFRGG